MTIDEHRDATAGPALPDGVPAIAMLLPWVLHRLGRDPAFGSGPLATVVQDLLSIAISSPRR